MARRRSSISLDLSGPTQSAKIRVTGELREHLWGNDYGPIRARVREAVADGVIRTIAINCDRADWVDVIPLSAMLLDLHVYAAKEISLRFELASEAQSSEDLFTNFAMLQGFAFAAHSLGYSVSRGGKLQEPQMLDPRTIRPVAALGYPYSTFLPATVLEIPGGEPSADYGRHKAEELLRNAAISDRAVFPVEEQKDVLYRLAIFLQETLQNVLEHAYSSENTKRPGRCLVYSRVRHGRRFWATEDVQEILAERESRNFGIQPGYLDDRDGFVEAFVIDVGCGIQESVLSRWTHLSWSDEQRELKAIIQRIFNSEPPPKKGSETRVLSIGGLSGIREHMRPALDNFRGYTSGFWLRIPKLEFRDAEEYTRAFSARKDELRESTVPGTAISMHLGWAESSFVDAGWRPPPEITEVLLTQWTEQDAAIFNKNRRDWRIVDEREREQSVSIPPEINAVLWFPKSGRDRNHVIARLKQFLDSAKSRLPSLFIYGIERYEYHSFDQAIRKGHLSSNIRGGISRIYVITTALACFQYKELRPRGENQERVTYFPVEIGHEGSNWLVEVMNEARTWESRVFWRDIRRLSIRPPVYTSGLIGWGKTSEGQEVWMAGHLDLRRALDVERIHHRVEHGLRLLEVLRGGSLIRVPMDPPAEALCESPIPWEGEESNGNQAIASVVVTGSSLGGQLNSANRVFAILRNPTLSGHDVGHDAVAAFRWRPHGCSDQKSRVARKITCSTTSERIERVGNSPFVAVYGRHFYHVPRFGNLRAASAESTPKRTYETLQSPMPMLGLGHWHYQNTADIVGLPISKFVARELSLGTRTQLSSYLLKQLVFPLVRKILISNPDNANMIVWRSDEVSRYFEDSRYDVQPADALVYPSHPSVNAIVSRILDLAIANSSQGMAFRKYLQARCLSVVPLGRRKDRAATLPAPPNVDALRDLAAESGSGSGGRAIVFDDAVISGRTLQDLGGVCREAGFDDINEIVLVNRLREPGLGITSARISAFFRLDLPTIGTTRDCKFCRALHALRRLEQLTVYERLRETLRDIIRILKPANPEREYYRAVKDVSIAKLTKRLGCRKEEPIEEAIVELSYIAAVALYNIELMCMTGLDDFVIQFCRKERESLGRTGTLLVMSVALLLFGTEIGAGTRAEIVFEIVRQMDGREIEGEFLGREIQEAEGFAIAALVGELASGSVRPGAIDFNLWSGRGFDETTTSTQLLWVAFAHFGHELPPAMGGASRALRDVDNTTDVMADYRGYLRGLYEEGAVSSGATHETFLTRLAFDGPRALTDKQYSLYRRSAVYSIDRLVHLLSVAPLHRARSGEWSPVCRTEIGRLVRRAVEREGKELEGLSDLEAEEAARGAVSVALRRDVLVRELLQARSGLLGAASQVALGKWMAAGGYDEKLKSTERAEKTVGNRLSTLVRWIAKFRSDSFTLDLTPAGIDGGDLRQFVQKEIDRTWHQWPIEDRGAVSIGWSEPDIDAMPSVFELCIPWDQGVADVFSRIVHNVAREDDRGDEFIDPWESAEGVKVGWIRCVFKPADMVVEVASRIIDGGAMRLTIERAVPMFNAELLPLGGEVLISSIGVNVMTVGLSIPYAGRRRRRKVSGVRSNV